MSEPFQPPLPIEPTADQLAVALRLFGMDKELVFVRFVANHVYRGMQAGRVVYLRLTPVERRTSDEIEAELHWMRYLSASGLRVGQPIPAQTGEYVQRIEGSRNFHAVLFDAVKGERISVSAGCSLEFVEAWGHYIGQMHKLTQSYIPSSVFIRKLWDKDDTVLAAQRSIEVDDPEAKEIYLGHLEWLQTLSQSPEFFGLVHCDLHTGNFLVEDGLIGAFDFDDACYHWFAYDFATAFNAVLGNLAESGRWGERNDCFAYMVKGLEKGLGSSPQWLGQVRRFVAFRTALVYLWIKTGVIEGVFATRTEAERQALLSEFRKWMIERNLDIF